MSNAKPISRASMTVTIPEQFKKLRAAVSFDSVSIAYVSVCLSPVAELQAAQQGYSSIPEGDETDWRDEWVVVGYEDLCGDPIFIDISDDGFPVYTAAHGMGEWSPQPIAGTFQHFIEILQQLQLLARGRTTPVEIEKHPIAEQELESFLTFIRRGSPEADLTFWQSICET